MHIADVSHFVRPKTALDREALGRATSVYFPGQVVPMLPERLSNDLCSLREAEDRLTYTVRYTVSPQGKIARRSLPTGEGAAGQGRRRPLHHRRRAVQRTGPVHGSDRRRIRARGGADDLGIPAIILFGIPAEKDPVGEENFSPNGIVQQTIRALKTEFPSRQY